MALFGELTYALIQPSTRAIGTVFADVTIEENHRDEVIITQHPVEGGGIISDHAYKRPAELEIRCGFSNSSAGYVGYVQQQYQALLALETARQPFTVYTGKRRYRNMLIRAVSVLTNQHSENSLMVSVALQEIILVSTQTTAGTSSGNSAPGANSSQADPASTGSISSLGSVDGKGQGAQSFAGAFSPGSAAANGDIGSLGGSVGEGLDGISPGESVALPEIAVTTDPSTGGLQDANPDYYNMFGGGP